MKSLLRPLVLASLPALLLPGCNRPEPAATNISPENQTHPLRGTIVEVRAAESVLRVKHEAIPGFMGAMTMPFHVDATTLQAVAPGQAITATLYQKDGDLWLRDVKPAAR
jgi:protein SCO1/2